MDAARALCVVLLAAGCSPGSSRRSPFAASSSDDDFFRDHKDLLAPPKDLLAPPRDLLETPKDLTETSDDLVDTPDDLVESPKGLIDDDHRSEDFEEFAKYGSHPPSQDEGQEQSQDLAEQDEAVDGEDSAGVDDTAAHDEQAELSLAKHLQGSSIGGDPLGDREREPTRTQHRQRVQQTPVRTYSVTYSPNEQRPAAFGHAPGATSGSDFGSSSGPVRTLYHQARPQAAPQAGQYVGNLAGNQQYNGRLGERRLSPEYSYRYGVHDPTTKDVKSAWEHRDGEDTRGGYALVEPNGQLRLVEYTVTKHGGFNARVKHVPTNVI